MTCDGCGEEWEEGFFCKRCSGGELDEDYEDDPLDYSNCPRQIPVIREVWKNICGNCCGCHLRS